MDSSYAVPPFLISRFSTIPPPAITDSSVVSPPKLTIKSPFAFFTSRSSPTAAAIERSTIFTSFALAVEWITRSKNAFFSTSVTSVGTAMTYSDPLANCRPAFSRFCSKNCILLNLEITPSFIGNTTSILAGAFPYIAYAVSPTAKISFWSLIAMTFFSFQMVSFFLS